MSKTVKSQGIDWVGAAPRRALLLQEWMEHAVKRRAFWFPGGQGSVSYQEGHAIWIRSVDGRFGAIDTRRLEKGLTALVKRRSNGAGAVAVATVIGEPIADAVLHACLPGSVVSHLHSGAALLMAHLRHDPKFRRWLRSRWKEAAFVSPKNEGAGLSSQLVALREKTPIIVESHGVLLQSETEPGSCLEKWWQCELEFCSTWGFPLFASSMRGAYSLGLPAPLKSYYPVVATWKERIFRVLDEVSGGRYVLKKIAWKKDWDAAELFWMCQLLYTCAPGLKEVISFPPISVHSSKAKARS